MWGAYHGFLLIIYRIWKSSRFEKLFLSPNWRLIKVVFFFHIICLGWLFFRAQSFGQIHDMMLALWHFPYSFQSSGEDYFKFVMIIIPILIVQIFQWRKDDLLFLFHLPSLAKTVIYAFMTYLIFGWGVTQSHEFIYFQF
jgi:D-alanyl-lipoteichoic acid acyltransferase DltB (MBOAT superfamily)